MVDMTILAMSEDESWLALVLVGSSPAPAFPACGDRFNRTKHSTC